MKNKKIGIKKTRFFNWCRTLDAITGYRRILFGSEVQELKLYHNSKNVLDSEKNTPSFFLINYRRCLIPTRYLTTQVTTVLQYSSELQSKLTRIKAFLSVQFVRELGKTGNNETKNNAKNKNSNNRSAKKQEHVMR